MKQIFMNNILVIEDNPADAMIIRELLDDSNLQHRLFHTSSLAGGLELIHEQKIDLVLLDLSLDDIRGFTTLTKYLKVAGDTPVIVFTGNKNEVIGIQSVKAGAQDFLVKGEFDSRRLISSIEYSMQRFKDKSTLIETVNKLAIKDRKVKLVRKIAQYGTWEMDIVNNTLSCSDEIYEFLELPKGSIMSLSDLLGQIYFEDQQRVEHFFEKAIRTGKVMEVKCRTIRKNRSIKQISIRAQVQYEEISNKLSLFGSLQEITDKKSDHKEEEIPLKKEKPSALQIIDDLIKERSNFDLLSGIGKVAKDIQGISEYLKKESISNAPLLELISSFNILANQLHVFGSFPFIIGDDYPSRDSLFSIEDLEGVLNDNFISASESKRPALKYKEAAFKQLHLKADLAKLQQLYFQLIRETLLFNQNNVYQLHLDNQEGNYQLVLSFNYLGEASVFTDIKTLVDTGTPIPEYRDLNTMRIEDYLLAKLIYALKGEILIKREAASTHKISIGVPVLVRTKKKSSKAKQELSVLLVENHIMTGLALKRALYSEHSKLTIVTSATVEDMLEKISTTHFDLVLLKRDMPNNSCTESITIIKAHKPIPIISIGTSFDEEEKNKCEAAGASAYIARPFKPRDLLTLMDKVLAT